MRTLLLQVYTYKLVNGNTECRGITNGKARRSNDMCVPRGGGG